MCALSKDDKIQHVSQTVGKFLVLLLVLLLSVGITAGQGQIYHVSPDGSDTNIGSVAAPFATIQHALNIVQPGDTLMLQPGTYIESVSIQTSNITLIGQDGVELLPIPNGDDEQATVTLAADGVTLRGLTFSGHPIAIAIQATGVTLDDISVMSSNSGVVLDNALETQIINSRFENNRTVDIYLNDVDGLTIQNSVFINDGSFGDVLQGDYRRSTAISSFFSARPVSNVVLDRIEVRGYSYYGIDIRTRNTDDSILWARNIQLINSTITNNGTAFDPDEDGSASYNFGGVLWQGVDGGAVVINYIAWNIGWGMDCYVCNNILYANNLFVFNIPQQSDQVGPGIGLEVNAGYSNRVIHNVFYGNDTGLFSSYLVNPGDGGPSSVEIVNNTLIGNTGIDGDYEAFGGGDEAEFPFIRDIRGNIFGRLGFGASRDELADANVFDVDVSQLFVDPLANNYRLLDDSPAVVAALPTILPLIFH